jgi:hypothetical protein
MESSELQNLSIAELQTTLDQLRASWLAEFGADIPDAQKSADMLRIEGINAQMSNVAADRKKKANALITEMVAVQSRIKVLQRASA